jgi:SpoVK/Ycf46/Vps4 family AAA+-type ATPase
MNESLNTWHTHNSHYLSLALAWLRLRLQIFIDQGAVPRPADSLFAWMGAGPAGAGATTKLERAAAMMAEAARSDPPPALMILANRLGLSSFEQAILLLSAAMELDTGMPNLCAQAQDDANRPYPTFALAMALFDEPAWDALSPEGPLRRWRLIEISQPAAQPLTTSPIRADERIVNYIKGLNYLDDRLAPLLVPFDAAVDGEALPPSQQEAVALTVRYLTQAPHIGPPPVIQLLGPDPTSKQLVAQAAAEALDLLLYRMPVGLLPAQVSDLETVARLWERESILLPLALYLDAHEANTGDRPEEQAPPLHRFLGRSHGLFFLGTREIRPGLGATVTAVEVTKPTAAEQQVTWTNALSDAGQDQSPGMLAGQFNLNATTIRQVAALARAAEDETDRALPDRLWDACLANTRPRMDLLAQRLDPKATWDDIVLPEETAALLHEIADQVRQRAKVYDTWGFRRKMSRGLGISALFAGESGTGKTMAAEVLANELRLNLYRIDLSQVVSKYIGKTEKNLRKLFDAAEDGGMILFFDEADALFGKRSEVRDSHDRYANVEISYLLQRMEAYHGLAILATNMRSALDHAFVRRLRFIVNFAFPDAAQRKAIWRKIFPTETPLGNLDYDHLARLNVTGGSIHNIALNAAFLAAQGETRVTMPLLLRAARAEFRKLERPVSEGDFRWEEPET